MENGPINGKGEELVNLAEGIRPKVNPWEVEGEKELLIDRATLKDSIIKIDSLMKQCYDHSQTCSNPNCGALKVFSTIMRIRRHTLYPLLASGDFIMYEAFYSIIGIYIVVRGDDKAFISNLFVGISLIMKILQATDD